MIFDVTGKTNIGLYPATVSLPLPGFGIGTTLAVFQSLGNLPFEIDKFTKYWCSAVSGLLQYRSRYAITAC